MKVVVHGLGHYFHFVCNKPRQRQDREGYSLGRSSLPKSTVMSPLLLVPNS